MKKAVNKKNLSKIGMIIVYIHHISMYTNSTEENSKSNQYLLTRFCLQDSIRSSGFTCRWVFKELGWLAVPGSVPQIYCGYKLLSLHVLPGTLAHV